MLFLTSLARGWALPAALWPRRTGRGARPCVEPSPERTARRLQQRLHERTHERTRAMLR